MGQESVFSKYFHSNNKLKFICIFPGRFMKYPNWKMKLFRSSWSWWQCWKEHNCFAPAFGGWARKGWPSYLLSAILRYKRTVINPSHSSWKHFCVEKPASARFFKSTKREKRYKTLSAPIWQARQVNTLDRSIASDLRHFLIFWWRGGHACCLRLHFLLLHNTWLPSIRLFRTLNSQAEATSPTFGIYEKAY